MKAKPFPSIPWSNHAIFGIAKIFAERAADQFDEYEGHVPLCFVFPRGRDSSLVELNAPKERIELWTYYRKLGMEIREFLGCRPVGIVTIAEVGHEEHPKGKDYKETLDILVEHNGRQPFLIRYPIQVLIGPEGEMKRRVNRAGILLGYGRCDHRSMLGHFVLGPGKLHPDLGPRTMPTCDFNLGPFWKWISDPEKKVEGPQKVEKTGTPTLSDSKSAKS